MISSYLNLFILFTFLLLFFQDRAGTVTTPATTTTTAASTAGPGAVCQNGGAYVNGFCQCPSGFSGPICGTQDSNYVRFRFFSQSVCF